MQTLQRACRLRIEEAFQTAEAHYNTTIKRVPIVFSNQQKKTAGTASYTRCFSTGKLTGKQIKLANSILRLNPEEFVARTPGHEAAHIIAVELFGNAGHGHGRRWKEVMGVVGQKAERCHNMETAPTRKGVQYRYVTTTGQEVMLGQGRHAKILRGAVYTMRGNGKITKECYTPANPTPIQAVAMAANAKAKAPQANKPQSKADVVKAQIAKMKGAGYTLEAILGSEKLVQIVAVDAGLTQGLCRTYLKNNWRKV
ncbi:MAG: hypothetical protein DRQ40_07480 [Gammaproteobacteria bacterium]|nr:MAG: hypothetical protein DRQ40_07480 [Gammaproteobacteria bacterium]